MFSRTPEILGFIRNLLKKHWLLCFFILTIAYLEFLYRVWIFKNISIDYLFPLLFGVSAGTVLYLIICLIPLKAAHIVSAMVTFVLTLCYGVQLVYFSIFRTPLSFISLRGAGDALQLRDIVTNGILNNIAAVILVFVPFILLFICYIRLSFSAKRPTALRLMMLFCVSVYCAAIICVNLTGYSPLSQNTLYYKASSPELSVKKLGLLTTMRLDLKRFIAGTMFNSINGNVSTWAVVKDNNGMEEKPAVGSNTGESRFNSKGGSSDTTDFSSDTTGGSSDTTDGSSDITEASKTDGNPPNVEEPTAAPKPYNVMDINFNTLLASGKADVNYNMHKYFSTVQPTAVNEYTGMFKGYNLILLTAEAFSPYVISAGLTPTLYKMSTEGFAFKNFYNPVWWVSTSDGEYAACTGLIPKSGVWSFAASGKNYMPFTLGNQFRKLGYTTKAYHDHTYTYYKRNVSHPNMGYDYKGVGNGLDIKKSWPESDLEMINATANEYIGQQPFHTYYMTVSGHMNYSFGGNYMAGKNRKLVEGLPYSNASKAYIACNLELEFAMKALLDKLESAGIAEKTIIALSADHYPYGLAKENLDELAGHELEPNFELYKSTFILWKKGMEPVIVDKPCASLDILPTLSNLFGLEYDSRLLMGSDILSDSAPLVIFSNRSWITDRAAYNTVTDSVHFYDGTIEDKAYIKQINKIVADKFNYSAKILDADYYRRVVP